MRMPATMKLTPPSHPFQAHDCWSQRHGICLSLKDPVFSFFPTSVPVRSSYDPDHTTRRWDSLRSGVRA